MGLAETIEKDYITAYKAKEAAKIAALRMVKADIVNYKIEKKKDKLDDQDVIQILQNRAKQHRESLESFQKANRAELAAKEEQELKALSAYLPKQLSETELEGLVKQAISEVKAAGKQDMGKVMKAVMPKVKGRADGKAVNAVVSKLLTP